MVGLFHLGSKGSPSRASRSTDTPRSTSPPPPPYRQHVHEPALIPAASTTTTTRTVMTTTETTTHFFSLPLWRRRTQQIQPTAHDPPPGIRHPASDELGMLRESSSAPLSIRNKELPPTPPTNASPLKVVVEEPPSRMSKPHNLSTDGADASAAVRASIMSHAFPSTTSLLRTSGAESAPSTSALARAALGLGLPPLVIGTTLDLTEELGDNNATSFASTAPPRDSVSPKRISPAPSMRRAKSFYKEGEGNGTTHVEAKEQRRSRGLSMGLLSSPEHGAKEKLPEQKPLSRKSSFWTRKRNDSRTPLPVVAPPPEAFLGHPSLPSLQPVSPFHMDTSISDSPVLRTENLAVQPAELRRRHSERVASSSSSHPLSQVEGPPEPTSPRRKRVKRPQTADSSASPRLQSSYFTNAPLVDSPPATPLPRRTMDATAESRSPPVPQRPRAATNPPFLHRLSINLFGSSPGASPVANGSSEVFTRSPSTSFSSSSRPSMSRPSPKVSVDIPRPRHEEESPELYLQRLVEAVSKAEVAGVLAASADEFHAKALQAYISRFDFNHDPLDVALRRLLMDVGLPRETQQIDRVMEAFAARYRQCHPNLFGSDDHPYILAFSLIMLHTDAFNKSNKRKMTKADYMKNTRLPGVPSEVLDCFYDNIVFAPFIFIEDPVDVNGQHGLLPEASSRRLSTLTAPSPGGLNGSSSTLLGKNNKVDPYYLITRNLLDDLRVDIRSYVPLTSPYFYLGSLGKWDDDKLLRAFARASLVEVAAENRYLSSPWFGLNVGGGPNNMAMMAVPPYTVSHEVLSLKVTKVGFLQRKDDVLEGGRKAGNRKWKEWSVMLTGSQLLFSRDPGWASAIQSQLATEAGSVPRASIPRPDEMLSVRDAVAVFDRSYTKYNNTLRLVMPDGRHFLLQAKDEAEMNDWIACINYASTFKTAGVRMRSLGMSGKDIELTGQAAAVSHLRDIQHRNRETPSPQIRTWDSPSSTEMGKEWPEHYRSASETTQEEPLTPPMENPSRLFKATFDQVKAELASGGPQVSDVVSLRSKSRQRAYSLESTLHSPMSPRSDASRGPLSSRAQIIRSKVRDLESRIAVQQSQLDSDMRLVRNVAVLTPFQRSTRERLQTAVQSVAKRIMQVRLDMEKLTCHRDVLVKDLAAEEHEWQRTKTIALRAATARLELERKQSLPRMTLSMYLEGRGSPHMSSPTDVHHTPDSTESKRPQSATESFHSAFDDGLDQSGTSLLDDRQRLSVSSNFDSPASTTHTDGSSSPLAESPLPPRLTSQNSSESAKTSVDESSRASHDKFYTAPETPEEQAEDWNKTRAAKRVSLVRLPSDLRMSVVFGRHAREGSLATSDDTSTLTASRSSSSHHTFHAPFPRTNIVDE